MYNWLKGEVSLQNHDWVSELQATSFNLATKVVKIIVMPCHTLENILLYPTLKENNDDDDDEMTHVIIIVII